MNQEHGDKELSQSGRFAQNSLASVRAALRGREASVPHLFGDMRASLHWAVEHWLRQYGEPVHTGWADQETHFLRVAPSCLQEDYLQIAGAIPRLAGDLTEQLGSTQIGYFVVVAPSLAVWREKAEDWTQKATRFIEILLDVDASQPGGHRVERGRVEGNLGSLMPCLVLARLGGHTRRWRHGEGRSGLFQFGETTDTSNGRSDHEGLILPLSLCRDAELRGKLEAFATLLQAPADHSPSQGTAKCRRSLQSWLEQQQLNMLRLGDREHVRGWTRFTLNTAVFADLLGQFDYVTALADHGGETSGILDHAPFIWHSHGDLLDWAMDEGDGTSVSRFRLYLTTDVRGLTELRQSDPARRSLFRPLAYWQPYTEPRSDVQPANVSVRLTQGERDFGWIDLNITLGETAARVTLSDVYDPLPTLLDWLQAVREGDVPIGVDIDEEGPEARLIAHKIDQDHLLVAIVDYWEETVRGAATVDRNGFLNAFREEFLRFLSSELDVERWLMDGLMEDAGAYHERLLVHPFLVDD